MEKGLVSVIITTYNGADTILRSVNSALNQTYTNIEIIIHIDGSQDNTVELLKSIKDSRVHYYFEKKKETASVGRNFAISKSKGEYIALLDDDDGWEKEKLEKQISFLKNNPKYGAVVCNYTEITNKKVRKINSFSNNYKLDALLMRVRVAAGSNLLVRRNIFEKVGYFDPSFVGQQDIEVLIKVDNLSKVGHIPDYLVTIYGRSGRTAKSGNRLLLAKQSLLNKFKSLIEEYPLKTQKEIYARAYLQVSRAYSLESDFINSYKYLKLSLRYKILLSPKYKVIPFESYYLILWQYCIMVLMRIFKARE